MDNVARDILMGRNFAGSRQQLKPYIRRLPQLNELKLNSVPNTIVTCRVCRGGGVIVNDHSNGLMDYEPCPACQKTRVMRTDRL